MRQLLGLSFLFLAGFLAYLAMQPTSDSQAKPTFSVNDPKVQEIANRNLFLTAKQIELEQQKAEVENKLTAPFVGQKIIDQTHQMKPQGVDHSVDRSEEIAYRDLGRDRRDVAMYGPQHVIQRDLYEQQQLAHYTEEYQKEYARQFLENARRAGYEVTLSPDYVVLSVRKIRQSPR